MSDQDNDVCDAEVVEPTRAATAIQTTHEAMLEKARDKMARYAVRAIEIITELAETSENDRVRLSAAESIADRAGLGKQTTTTVTVNNAEHEAARLEAEEIVARLADNKAGPKVVVAPDLDTLVVLEGEIA